MSERSRVRRVVGGTVAAAAFAVGGFVAAGLVSAGGSASASGVHPCDGFFAYADDGVVTDPLHHYVEPLVPGLHGTSCAVQNQLNTLACQVPALALLRSSYDGTPCVPLP